MRFAGSPAPDSPVLSQKRNRSFSTSEEQESEHSTTRKRNRIAVHDPFLGRRVRKTDGQEYRDMYLEMRERNLEVGAEQFLEYPVITIRDIDGSHSLSPRSRRSQSSPYQSPKSVRSRSASQHYRDDDAARSRSPSSLAASPVYQQLGTEQHPEAFKRHRLHRKDPFLGRQVRASDKKRYTDVLESLRKSNRDILGEANADLADELLVPPTTTGSVPHPVSTGLSVKIYGGYNISQNKKSTIRPEKS